MEKKGKLKNFLKKHKKLIIIFCTLIVVVVICIIVIFKLFFQNQVDEDKLFKDLIYKDYLVSYIFTGNIEVGDAYADFDGVRYYAVIDEKLKDIKTSGQILKFLEEDFEENWGMTYREEIKEDKYNIYQALNGTLYVHKREPQCQVFDEPESEYTKTEVNDNELYLNTTYHSINILKVDGKWLLTSLDYKCRDNIEDIEGQEDNKETQDTMNNSLNDTIEDNQNVESTNYEN